MKTAIRKIYGHEKQRESFRTAVANNRLAHAYLFYGMDGIGKKVVANSFAQALVCLTGLPDACGVCSACHKAQHDNHPDIIAVQAKTQFIKIDDVRLIQEQVSFRPFEAKRRIFIIDEADRMNREAANALLKTLEEPSAANVFFLISSRHNTLLPTVRSRCQKI